MANILPAPYNLAQDLKGHTFLHSLGFGVCSYFLVCR